MTRSCGSCTMCCKTMGVPDMEPRKPPGRWCGHCAIGVGCKVYEDRPTSCRDFACVWLQDERGLIAEELRPDKSRVVLVPTSDGCGMVAHCDPSRPLAWRENAGIYAVLKACAAAGFAASAKASDGTGYTIIGERGEVPLDPSWIIAQSKHDATIRVPQQIAALLGIGRHASGRTRT